MDQFAKELLSEIALKGVARHGGQLAGGSMIATGINTGDWRMLAGGGAVSLGAFAWSAIRKIVRARKQKKGK